MVSRGLSLGREGESRARLEGVGGLEAHKDVRLTSPIVGHGWPLVMWRGVGRGSKGRRESVQDKNRRMDAPSHGGGKLSYPAPLSLV